MVAWQPDHGCAFFARSSCDLLQRRSDHIFPYAIVSQGAHLCTAGHNIDHHDFPLTAAPIRLGPCAWIAAEAFVGPGVNVAEGAVLGARG